MAETKYDSQREKVAPPRLGIAALRKSHRLTQEAVADSIASVIDKPFSGGSLSLIELGHRGASAEVLRALEQVFGLASGDLSVEYKPGHDRRKSVAA